MDEGSQTQLLNLQGLSDPIDILIGVKQGDPLSGVKFILGINPIFEVIQNNRRALHCLGYADDIAIVEDSEEDMLANIQRVIDFTRKLGLELNPLKCHAIHIDSNAQCIPTEFLENTPVPSLKEFMPSKYLGKPFGFNIFEDIAEIDKLIETGSRILESELAPWQKLDALKSFFYPSMNHAMRTSQQSISQWKRINTAMRPLNKKVLDIPSRANLGYLHGETESGLSGIPVSTFDAHIAKIDSAYKLLSSNDHDAAWEDLVLAVSDRVKNPTRRDIQDYLDNVEHKRTDNRFSSLWGDARKASGAMGVKWQVAEDRTITLLCGTQRITDKRKIFSSLRKEYRKNFVADLCSKKQQGKTLECFSATKVSNHFNRTGDFLRFMDWRFIHRARLCLIKLNAYNPKAAEPEKQCRRCNWAY